MTDEMKLCLKCKKPLCSTKCPAGLNIPLILSAYEKGNYQEAVNEILKKHCIPFITGPLCDQEKQCGQGCIKNLTFMKDLETKLGEYFLNNECFYQVTKESNLNVCIIGSGVAGLSVAYQLLKNGVKVTIFEKDQKLGGIITNHLPMFRYDHSKVEKFINNLLHMGLEVNCGFEFGKNLLIEDLKEFDKVVLAMGTTKYVSTLPVCANVFSAFNILRSFVRGDDLGKYSNKKVIVLGGGNVAYDVSRALNKIGANVNIVYRRDIANSPASIKEVKLAVEEGIKIEELKSPTELVYNDNGTFKGVLFEKMALVDTGEKRKSIKGLNEFELIECDYVIEALGSRSNYNYLKQIKPEFFNEYNYIKDDYLAYNDNIYLCGDYHTGASTFVNASSNGVKIANIILEKVDE